MPTRSMSINVNVLLQQSIDLHADTLDDRGVPRELYWNSLAYSRLLEWEIVLVTQHI